jgi:hypothetical protein
MAAATAVVLEAGLIGVTLITNWELGQRDSFSTEILRHQRHGIHRQCRNVRVCAEPDRDERVGQAGLCETSFVDRVIKKAAFI